MKKIRLRVNGVSREVVVDPETALLELLREDLHLTGAKQSCDRKGQCGACTVIVDGKAVRSCLAKVAELDGADVITVEGLGTPDNPHLIQEAFVLSGAIQCGFCTPGMIMADQGPAGREPGPNGRARSSRPCARNLCRCTGYMKIIEAVQLAGRFLRGETTPEAVRPDSRPGHRSGCPTRALRPWSRPAAPRSSRRTIALPGALELAVVRSHLAARAHRLDRHLRRREDARRGRGADRQGHQGHQPPEGTWSPTGPCSARTGSATSATRCWRWRPTPGSRRSGALAAVKVEYEPLPILGDPRSRDGRRRVQIHAEVPNLCYDQPQIKGDAGSGPAPIRPPWWRPSSRPRSTTRPRWSPRPASPISRARAKTPSWWSSGAASTSTTHLGMLQEALGWENMRYEEAFSGGQFGIKVGHHLRGHRRRRPPCISGGRSATSPAWPSRMLMTSKRHAFDMKVKLAADTGRQAHRLLQRLHRGQRGLPLHRRTW